MSAFHEIRFPVSVSFRSTGGPERRTEVIELASGYEERNTPWQHARRRYDAGLGVRSLADIESVLAFYEARMGRLHGFRWKDFIDSRSCAAADTISASDQMLGDGDGSKSVFQISKTYETGSYAYRRIITKPVENSLQIAVAGVPVIEGTDYSVNYTLGEITFVPGSIPGVGQAVTAGFEFDVPVRFDTDLLSISLETFQSGAILSIPVVEVR